MILTTYGVMEGGKLMKKNFYKKAASVVLSVAMVTGGTVVPNVVAYADNGTGGQQTNDVTVSTDGKISLADALKIVPVEGENIVYKLLEGGTGAGKIFSSTLNVTKVGTFNIEVSGLSDTTKNGTYTINVVKGNQTIAKPTISARKEVDGKLTIALNKITNAKFGYATENDSSKVTNWSANNYYQNLDSSKTYYFFAKLDGTEFLNEAVSEFLEVKSENVKPVKKDIKITAVTKSSYTYDGKAIKLSDLFTVDKTDVSVEYSITGGTGEATINGNELVVTKAGTLEIKAEVKASDKYNAASATNTITVEKGTKTVSAPELDKKDLTSVTLKAQTGVKYGCSSTNGVSNVTNWQDSTTFTGLKAGETYYFFAKVEGTDLYNDSVSSALTVTLSSEIGNVSVNVTAPATGQTAQSKIDATDSYTGTIAWKDASGKAFSGAFKSGTEYTAVVTLTPKTGYVFASNVDTNGWDKSIQDGKLVLTKKFAATKTQEKKPAAEISYKDEKLTDLVKGSTYIIEGKEYKTASNGTTISIPDAWFGKTISIVKKGTNKTDDSYAQMLKIPSRPDAPTRKLKVKATKTRVEITNADDYNKCEFSMDKSDWQNSGTFKGTFKNGKTYTVYVREKATSKNFASKPAYKEFEIDKSSEYNLSGDNRIDRGESITFRVRNADEGDFEKILIDDEKLADRYFSVSESGSYVVVKVKGSYTEDLKKGDHDVEIVFNDGSAEGTFKVASSGSSSSGTTRYYTIKATAGKGGSISHEGSKEVKKGSDITYTITPDRGYKISDVYVNGRSKGDISKYTFKDVDSDNKIEAEFVKEKKDDIPFTDVYETDSFYDAVVDVYKKGLMAGTSDTTFSPNSTLTRAMVVKTLYNIEGMPKVYGRSSFTDVPSNEWYSDAVAWAQSVGIASGMTKTTFNPNGYVTKEQAAQFLYTYAKFKGYNVSEVSTLTGYVDAPTGWSRPAVSWAVGSGIMKGYGSGYAMYLAPSTNALRSDIAMMLSNFTDKY
ncbi:MAG: S-layer homology domain-containing protein [Clostridiales bacterium]|nr:S-layer homology domain-containing protein [Clostridiales bacterium]